MPPKPSFQDYALLAGVAGGFLLVVIVAIVSRSFDHGLGAMLLAVGIIAVVYSGRVSAAKAAIGERLPLWPGPNTLRPFTVKLWGIAVAILGLFMLAGVR